MRGSSRQTARRDTRAAPSSASRLGVTIVTGPVLLLSRSSPDRTWHRATASAYSLRVGGSPSLASANAGRERLEYVTELSKPQHSNTRKSPQ